MNSGQLTSLAFDALSAFWPGMQALYGDVTLAAQSAYVYHHLIWRRYGMVPDYWGMLFKAFYIPYI